MHVQPDRVCVACCWLSTRTTTAVVLGRNRVQAECLLWLGGERAACPAGLLEVVRARVWRCDTENKGETEAARRGWGEKMCCDGVG